MTTAMEGLDVPIDDSLAELNDDDFAAFLDDIIDPRTSTSMNTGSQMDMAPVAIATHAIGDEHGEVTQAPIVPLNVNVPPAKYAVDFLDPSTITPMLHPSIVRGENVHVGLEFTTQFQKKYFRFDNKMLQCFPRCEKFQDVREARMLGLDHGYNDVRRSGGAWCSGVVSATLTVSPQTNPGLLQVRGRFVVATPDTGVMPGDFPQFLSVGQQVREIPSSPHIVTGSVVVLTYRGAPVTDATGRVALAVHFQPGINGWIHDMELPRHRRNVSQQGARVTIPLFLFEVMVFIQDAVGYTVLARATSSLFEVSSVRTLLREALLFRQSVAAANAINQTGAVPPQKKTKVRKFQRTSSGASSHSQTVVATTSPTTPQRRESLLMRFLRLSVR